MGTVDGVLYAALVVVVVSIHLAYIAFLPAGGFLAWRWPRVAWVHLAALAVGLVSVTVHFDCPLTNVEDWARRRGGMVRYHAGFVDRYLAGRVYPHGYDVEVQLLVAAAVFVSYAGLAVRRPRRLPRSCHP